MELVHGNETNFEELISKGVVLVDFFAEWCGPCKMLGPVLEELSSEYEIVKIDVDQNPGLARQFGIMSVPTLMIFKDSKVVDKKSGFMPKDVIADWIETVK